MKNKKIGILTFHNVENYGAFLQAYALWKYLSKDNDVTIINYINKTVLEPYVLINTNSLKLFIKSFVLLPINLIKKIRFDICLKKYCKISKKMSSNQIKKNKLNEYDVLITGSDQVWNTLITKELDDIYALNFETRAKKISYAASLGNDIIKKEDENDFKNKISKIDFISVREDNTKKILMDIIDKKVEVVLDPTLLINKCEWEKFLKSNKNKEKYILVYAMTKNSKVYRIANDIAEKMDCKIIHFTRTNGEYNKKKVLKREVVANPREFVGLIRDAELVLTNTFHGTVFSIIFNKLFYCILPQNAGNRITELLRKLNLENRIIREKEEWNVDKVYEKIDYGIVNEILKKEQDKSKKFLELIK